MAAKKTPSKAKPVRKKSASPKKSPPKKASAGEISGYVRALSPADARIGRLLMKEIAANLPGKVTSKLYHGLPVWFMGENAVVGFRVTSKKGVNLLFWNGQALNEPELKASGKFMAAEIQFTDVSQINLQNLRRWIKKAGKDIWDFASLRKGN